MLVGVLVVIMLSSLALYEQIPRVYHIDIEQGDATLSVSPSDRTMLVDSGKNRHAPLD